MTAFQHSVNDSYTVKHLLKWST